MKLLSQFFVGSGTAVLLVTGGAKLYSAFGSAKLLSRVDPLLQIPYQQLLIFVGGIEVVLALALIFGTVARFKYWGIFWLSANFVLYRLANWLFDIPREHCPCLGHLSDQLHLNPKQVEAVLQWIAIYLFVGSGLALLFSSGLFERINRVVREKASPVTARL